MKKIISALAALTFVLPALACAQTTADLQALSQQVVTLQQQMAGGGNTNLSATGSASNNCPNISRVLKLGSTGDDVARLQQFLALDPSVYPEGTISGYFGALTEKAVQRWQAKYNIVSSGSPATTGYGVVGPRTAAAMALVCANSTNTSSRVGGYIQVSPTAGKAPLNVSVQATVNSTNSCTGAIYQLNWGDNTNPVSISVAANNCQPMSQTYQHTYASPGTYQITLSSGTVLTGATVTVSNTATSPTPTPTPTPSPTPQGPPATISVSITPASAEIGRPMQIKYKVGNPPSNGAVALWLAKTNGEKVTLLASQLEADTEMTTYPWTVPSGVTPDTYKILGQVYSPITKDVNNPNSGTVHGESLSSSFAIKAVGTGGACTVLANDLAPGDTDATKGGEVTKLQQFLAQDSDIYPEGTISGFYGAATRRAVERWQAAHGIATSGSVDTNGYGAVGPKTRAAIAANCSTAGASLSGTPRSGPATLKVTFKGKVTQAGIYTIDFGDGSTATNSAPNDCPTASSDPNALHICNLLFTGLTHVYQNNGTYIAKLTAQGAATPLTTFTITVGGALEEDCAAITHQLTSGDTDAAKGGDVSRLQTYLARTPAIYPEGLTTGYYGPATVAAVKRYQAAFGLEQTGNVGPATLNAIKCGGPSLVLEATPGTGNTPLNVTFKTNLDLSGGSYRLEYGDGELVWLVSQTVTHTYTKGGSYTARIVKSLGNCFGLTGAALNICEIGYTQEMGKAIITVTSNVAGTMTVTPTSGTAPLDVTIVTTATSGCINDSGIDLGDGTVFSRAEVTGNTCGTTYTMHHTYQNPGTYTVAFKNNSTGGTISSATVTVNQSGGTNPPPPPPPGPGPISGCGRLESGQWIHRGQYVESCGGGMFPTRVGVKDNGAMYYSFQSGKGWIEYAIDASGLDNSAYVRGSLAWNYPNALGLKMGSNGKLQYYLTSTDVLWETDNASSPGAHFEINSLGQAVIITSSNFQVWPR